MVGDDDVLIRVHTAGICGTDVHIFKGEYEAIYPLIPGHEFSGVVAAVRAECDRVSGRGPRDGRSQHRLRQMHFLPA